MDKLPDLQADKFYQFKPFRVSKYRIRFERASRLDDIQGYTWYTPAALYLWGKFSEVTLADVVKDDDIKVFWYKFNKPIFKHFEVGSDAAWNHTLWAAETKHWNTLVDRVLQAVQFDMGSKSIYQYAMQSLSVYDPLFADSNGVIGPSHPKVNIHAFAVLSNVSQYAFSDKAESLPGMRTFKPMPLHVKAARKLFSSTGLTQDNAFERVKDILVKEQDEQRKAQIEKENKIER